MKAQYTGLSLFKDYEEESPRKEISVIKIKEHHELNQSPVSREIDLIDANVSKISQTEHVAISQNESPKPKSGD